MASAGIRELKNKLSRYIRRIEAGERVLVTAHGRVVAELAPPRAGAVAALPGRLEELIAAGVVHPPVESGDPFEDWPDIRLPRGTVAALIDSDRGETSSNSCAARHIEIEPSRKPVGSSQTFSSTARPARLHALALASAASTSSPR